MLLETPLQQPRLRGIMAVKTGIKAARRRLVVAAVALLLWAQPQPLLVCRALAVQAESSPQVLEHIMLAAAAAGLEEPGLVAAHRALVAAERADEALLEQAEPQTLAVAVAAAVAMSAVQAAPASSSSAMPILMQTPHQQPDRPRSPKLAATRFTPSLVRGV